MMIVGCLVMLVVMLALPEQTSQAARSASEPLRLNRYSARMELAFLP